MSKSVHNGIRCGTESFAAFKTSEHKQRRLLAEPDLTLKKAFEVAQAMESADTQVKEFQHPRMAEVHAVNPQF